MVVSLYSQADNTGEQCTLNHGMNHTRSIVLTFPTMLAYSTAHCTSAIMNSDAAKYGL